jgi:hypothetical protein
MKEFTVFGRVEGLRASAWHKEHVELTVVSGDGLRVMATVPGFSVEDVRIGMGCSVTFREVVEAEQRAMEGRR